MADKSVKNDKEKKAQDARNAIFTILTVLLIINIILSFWFYSGLVGQATTNAISSGFDQLSGLC